MEKFGREAGKNIGKKMSEEFDEVSTGEILGLLVKSHFSISDLKAIKPTHNKSQVQKIMGYGRFVGWFGECKLLEYEEGEKMTFKASNTFESHSYGMAGMKACSFLGGTLAGILEFFWDGEVEMEETQCASESEAIEACVFEVKAVES